MVLALFVGCLSCFPTQTVGTLSVGTLSYWYSFLFSNSRLLVLFLLVLFAVGNLSCFASHGVGTPSVSTLSSFPTQTVSNLSVGTVSCFLFLQIPVGTLSILTLSSPPWKLKSNSKYD